MLAQPHVACELVMPAEVFGDWMPVPYTSPVDKLYVPREGRAAVTIDQHVYPIRPGTALLIPAGCVHAGRVTTTGPLRKTFCHFLTTTAEHVPALRLMQTPRCVSRQTGRRVAELTDALLDEWSHARNARSLQAQSILLQIIVTFARSPAGHRIEPIGDAAPAASADDAQYDTIRDVIDHVQEHADQPLTLESLAAVAGWTPAHLTRTFRRLVGLPAMKYVERVRIRRACELLSATPDPVHAVATEVGYEDHAYFSRVFSRSTGVSPTAYRARHRLDPPLSAK
ncbi:MAG: AraC family transcriptional regulator [Planctomycetota bacterium]